ncbi:hypothetical protein ACX0G7_10290 [Flavitalea antarctica]
MGAPDSYFNKTSLWYAFSDIPLSKEFIDELATLSGNEDAFRTILRNRVAAKKSPTLGNALMLTEEIYSGKLYEIRLTEDNPNNVKTVFNNLLIALKSKHFNFRLDDTTGDLYFHLCKEYIAQINAELTAVHKQLVANDLIDIT